MTGLQHSNPESSYEIEPDAELLNSFRLLLTRGLEVRADPFKRLIMEFSREINDLLRGEATERTFSGQTSLHPFTSTSEADLFEVTAENGGSLRRKMNDGQIGEWLSVCKHIY